MERKDVRRSPANLLREIPREFRKFGSNRIECGFDLSNENFPQPFASWEGLRSNQEVRAVFAVSGLFENSLFAIWASFMCVWSGFSFGS